MLQNNCIAWSQAIVVRILDELRPIRYDLYQNPLYLHHFFMGCAKLANSGVPVAKRSSHVVGGGSRLTIFDFFVSCTDNKVSQT